jgi:hypothetical protein
MRQLQEQSHRQPSKEWGLDQLQTESQSALIIQALVSQVEAVLVCCNFFSRIIFFDYL